jgi:hypothetical protein
MPDDDIPQFLPPPPRERPLRADRTAPEATSSLPPPPPPPQVAPAPVVKRGVLDLVGERAVRRAEPRLGVGLAAAGSLMLVIGALAISGDQLVGEGGGADGSQFPGLIISLAVVVAGVVLTARFRHGPLAGAGVAASAVALPPFVFFLTFSKSSAPSFNTILLLSCVGWAAAYVLGPGRGHAFYLGSLVVGLWLWFLELTEHLFSFPLDILSVLAGSFTSTSSGSGAFQRALPDATNIGAYSLLFGGAYIVIGRVLDRRERRGMATPFVFGGVLTLVVGILALSNDLEQVGTGVLFAATGLILAYLGATEGRRATNWIGAALVGLGLTLVVAEPFDSATAFGFVELVVGGGVILGAHRLATQFQEPPEDVHVLSRFYSSGSVQPSGPPPPPAGSVLG